MKQPRTNNDELYTTTIQDRELMCLRDFYPTKDPGLKVRSQEDLEQTEVVTIPWSKDADDFFKAMQMFGGGAIRAWEVVIDNRIYIQYEVK